MSNPVHNIDKIILSRTYVVFIVLFLFGLTVLGKTFIIQYKEGESLRQKFKKLTIAVKNIEAVRGNVYAQDGTLLATSVPIYDIRIDTRAEGLTDEIFKDKIDSLALQLSQLFKDKSVKDYKQGIVHARRNRTKDHRYYLLRRNVRYNDLQRLRAFSFFKMGKNKSGLIVVQNNQREKPFLNLASRTIGYVSQTHQVGLESAYDKALTGVGGKQLMKKISGGVWMPINDEDELEPQDGYDIYTSIDVNLQDVAQQALETQLNLHQADHGCVVVMEVATGDVKAIANLSRSLDGSYSEKYNYAIGESTEPGSTIKLASLMVALEDGYVSVEDTVNTENGRARFYGVEMKDSHEGGYGKITLEDVFALSSNVGVAKTIHKYYSKNPQQFIDGLRSFGIHKPLGLEIPGEGKPYLKDTKSKSWSGLSLPWISYGYEMTLTPMQILAFYNAVANNGVYVRPRFVKEIRNKAELVEQIPVRVLNPKICSDKTLQSARKMLEAVVEKGTAKNLKNTIFKIAGKTGTAQISNTKYGYKYDAKVSYQASFVGYFPADAPKYSCIVVVNAPSNGVYYANLVAGPIFKEVAYKIYAKSIDIHQPINIQPDSFPIPTVDGNAEDLYAILKEMGHAVQLPKDRWLNLNYLAGKPKLQLLPLSGQGLLSVVNLSLKDALYVLENAGYHVEFQGVGKVKQQFPLAGTAIEKGQTVSLMLGL